MNPFMVVCSFRSGTDMADVMAVVGEEQAKVAELRAGGVIGAVYLATRDRGTVFLEVFADGPEGAREAVLSLPMARWWDLDVYPLNPPANPLAPINAPTSG